MSASEDPGELSERRRERIERWRPRMLAVWTVVGVFIASWLIIGALGDATFFEGSRLRGALSEEDRAAVEGHAAGLVDPRK